MVHMHVGQANLRMTDYVFFCYEAIRRHLHDGDRLVAQATEAVLRKGLIVEYIRNRQKHRPGFSKLNVAQAYDMLSITRDGHPTVAAILKRGIIDSKTGKRISDRISARSCPRGNLECPDPSRLQFLSERGNSTNQLFN